MLHFRFALPSDVNLYFKWTNDHQVRKNSFITNEILYDDHVKWFNAKLKSEICFFYLFFNDENIPVGQVRIEKNNEETIIGISIDKHHRGKSYGVPMLLMSCQDYFKKFPDGKIVAYIKENNITSLMIFKKAGFSGDENVNLHGQNNYKLYIRR